MKVVEMESVKIGPIRLALGIEVFSQIEFVGEEALS